MIENTETVSGMEDTPSDITEVDVSPAEGVNNETSATPTATDTAEKDGGKVTDAGKDKGVEPNAKEGGEGSQPQGLKIEDIVFPEGLTVTDEQKTSFMEELSSIGIKDKETAQSFLKWIVDKNNQAEDMFANQQEKEMGDLEAKWKEEGQKDPELGKDYDKNVSEVMNLMGQIFSPRTVEFLKDTKFAVNPDFLKDMLRLVKERSDAELIMGKPQNRQNGIKRDAYGNPLLTFNE